MNQESTKVNDNPHTPYRTERLWLYAVIGIALAGAVYLGTLAGEGQFTKVGAVLFVMVGTGVGLWMGAKVWFIIPLAFSFDLPPLPIGGGLETSELCMVGMTIVMLV